MIAPVSESQIRLAQPQDISALEILFLPFVRENLILARTKEQLEKHLPFTWVYTDIQKFPIASISLVSFAQKLHEIRGLCVSPEYQRKGIGSQLISYIKKYAIENYPPQSILFALTFTPSVFEKLGFTIVPKEKFPEKIFQDCSPCMIKENCKEIAVEYVLGEKNESRRK